MEETDRLTQATQTTLTRGERVGEVRYAIYTMTYCTTCKSEGRLVNEEVSCCFFRTMLIKRYLCPNGHHWVKIQFI